MTKINAILAFDVGTGSARAALIGLNGRILAQKSASHETFWADHGACEQSPNQWWDGIKFSFRELLQSDTGKATSILGVIGCGQMHAPILIDQFGELLLERVAIWNDKRGADLAESLYSVPPFDNSFNPPASAWPAIKLKWISKTYPGLLGRAKSVLMPKDYINFKLSAAMHQDPTEAGSSFVYDSQKKQWDDQAIQALDLPRDIFPPIVASSDQIGTVTPKASRETGIPIGTPVFAGGGDYPVAVLGSGVFEKDKVSDITGTSSLLSVICESPIKSTDVMNAHTPGESWKAFCVVDAGGDAVRWGKRAFNDEVTQYQELTNAIQSTPPGSDGLLFLPYLTGERLGYGQTSRASYLGLTAGHTTAHLHRAILEGTAFALRAAGQTLLKRTEQPNQIIAAGGGARSLPHLEMKASVFGCPYVPVNEVECGLVGCAILALKGLGLVDTIAEGVDQLVSYKPAIDPKPELQKVYSDQFEVFQSARSSIAEISRAIADLPHLK